MKRKWTWLLAAVLLAGLLAGASVLYGRLRRNQLTPEQPAQETPPVPLTKIPYTVEFL